MKWILLTVFLVTLVQCSTCSESEDKPSFGVGYEFIQARLDGMELKLVELLKKLDILLRNQPTEVTPSVESSYPMQISSNITIPTGCVKIRSFLVDKYLAVSSKYDSDRRNVALQRNPEQWTLVRQVGDYYRITSWQGQEDLYAAVIEYAYDTQRRRLFTWVHGFEEYQGKWEIEEAAGFPGMFHIRSEYTGEYLYAEDFENFVFTWRPKQAPGKYSKYVWQIEQC